MVLNKKKTGFTLVEIIISFSILAILILVVTTTIDPLAMINRGRDARRKSDLNKIKLAFEEYQNDKGYYPSGDPDLISKLQDKASCGKNVFSPWLKTWPCDFNGNPYYIVYDSQNSWFKVLANLEDKKDKDIPNGWYLFDNVYRVGTSASDIGINDVNYGVSSPNVSWFDVTIDPACQFFPSNHDADVCNSLGGGYCKSAVGHSCSDGNCYTNNSCDEKCKVKCCGSGCDSNKTKSVDITPTLSPTPIIIPVIPTTVPTLVPTPVVGKVNLNLDSDDTSLITESNLNNWKSRLTMAYDSYADLTGWVPYSGGKITIQSVECNKDSAWYYEQWACDYWAWAGQLIGWSKYWVKGELQRVNDNDDWSFGILHEISHDFDKDGWNFDSELMANFKMVYFLEQNNGKVQPGGTYFIGSQIEDYYSTPYNSALSSNIYSNDFLTYILLKKIKPQVGGWDIFKTVFRNLSSEGAAASNDCLSSFLDEISFVSKKDVKAMFTNQEKDIISIKFGKVFN